MKPFLYLYNLCFLYPSFLLSITQAPGQFKGRARGREENEEQGLGRK
jgi:hypothetical protein